MLLTSCANKMRFTDTDTDLSCTQAEADKINAAGAPVYEEGVYYGGGKQLGEGVYTSPYPGAWKQITGKWY